MSIIGKGAFGEVRVCREISTGEIVAIKKMRKEDMFQKNQIMHVRTEKEILTTARTSWVVNLRYSFQDDYFLYLVMDFLPGGDLMSLLMKKDILSEEEAKFYTAEMVLAIEAVHNLNSIHRDLKPDNILIDKDGHIQLSDFGLSKLSDNSFYPMSQDLKEKENSDTITNVTPSGNTNLKTNFKKEDIKNRKKNRLVRFFKLVSIFYCRHTRLHSSRSFFSKWLRSGSRLVVCWCYLIRNVSRLPAILF